MYLHHVVCETVLEVFTERVAVYVRTCVYVACDCVCGVCCVCMCGEAKM